MPSPTATIRPTSADTRLASKSLSRSLMTSEISLVLIPTRLLLLSAPRLRSRQAAAQLLQPGGHTRVDDPVSVLKLQPADDARIDDDAQPDLFVQTFRQLPFDALAVGTLELDRRGHGCADPTGRLVGQTLKLVLDRGRFVDASGFDEQPGQVGGLVIEQMRLRCNERIAPLGRDRRIAEHGRHPPVGEQLADLGQAPGPFFELTILLGQLEHGPRVPSGSAARARHRIFGPQATHLRCRLLRSSLAHLRMRSLRCSSAPRIWATWMAESLGAVTSHPACGCRRHSRPPRWPARSALGACDRQACRRSPSRWPRP